MKLFDSICLRHGKAGGSGRVRVRIGSIGLWVKRVILSGLKSGSGQSGYMLGRVDPYFSYEFFIFIFYFYKENNMHLPFEMLCTKLLDVKCIILNSPPILRMNPVKLINTYSIILKLYKS